MASAREYRMQGTEHDIALFLALGCAADFFHRFLVSFSLPRAPLEPPGLPFCLGGAPGQFFSDSSPWRVVPVDPTMLEPCGEHPCSCWIVRITRLAKLADRAFGAQRFSGGRAGRRFAPPSAAGSASRCHPSPPSPPHPNPTHLPTSIPTPPGFPESLLCSQVSKMVKHELQVASSGHFAGKARKCAKSGF